MFSPHGLVMAGVVAAAFVAMFWKWFAAQHRWSSGSEDWSHSYVVPVVSAYLLWQDRHRVARTATSVFWPGVLPLLLGIVCYVFFVVGVPNHLGQGLAVLLALFGVCALLLGPRMLVWLVFPLGYLVFAITLPERVMIEITFRLQLVASVGAYVLLTLLGIRTDLQGNVLTVWDSAGNAVPLNVAQACSGMRMVIAFVALGAAVSLVACRAWWQRTALLLLAVPVAVLVNIARVAFLGVASMWNPELAEGQAHMMIGTLWLLPGFGLYMLAVWALNRAVRPSGAGVS